MKTSKTKYQKLQLCVLVDDIYILFEYGGRLRTKSESYVSSVSETDGDGECEDHEEPVDLGNIDLAQDPSWFVNNLHTREASQCIALFDN